MALVNYTVMLGSKGEGGGISQINTERDISFSTVSASAENTGELIGWGKL